MIVTNQENIKVHFAGAENIPHMLCVNAANVKYSLFTVFPFIKSKKKLEDVRKNSAPSIIENLSKHCIMDSGLFTLMFGSHKGEQSESFLETWTDKILKFMSVNNYKGTYVEVDCQKVLGVNQAWRFRQYMKSKSKNRQINVFHIEDGQKGLDRLIEFSDYIALSIPELRILKKKEYAYRLATYIKNKKPNIDIHLLGCTEPEMLRQMKFCTSSDSTSWIAPQKFGMFHLDKNRRLKDVDKELLYKKYKTKVDKFDKYKSIKDFNKKRYLYYAALIFQCEYLKHKYSIYAGSQE